MPEFAKAMSQAIAAARAAMAQARADGDVDAVIVHEGRLEELSRIAAENGLSAA